jgi:nucleotide-binding universal stress UspA family protein
MKILIANDGSIHANGALDDLQWAGLPPHAQAVVISVVEESIPAPRSYGLAETEFANEQPALAERWCADAWNRLTGYFPQWDVQMETRWGSPKAVILDKAKDWAPDLIVVGTHGRSKLARAVLGSVSLGLVREAPCSVRVGRARKHEGPIRLLIGTDGSSQAEAAVEEICRRCWPPATQVRVVAVHKPIVAVESGPIAFGPEAYRNMNESERNRLACAADSSAESLRKAGLDVSSAIVEGDPADAMIHESRDWADAIFVGARGVGRVERLLLGSVSSAVVAHAPCTVEVFRERPKRI